MMSNNKTKLTLRVLGEDLEPARITEKLGISPSDSQTKGAVLSSHGGKERVAPFGMWRLSTVTAHSSDINTRIADILNLLSKETAVWDGLAKNYKLDLFCGLYMNESMAGLDLSKETMLMLAQRNIKLSFDIYAPN